MTSVENECIRDIFRILLQYSLLPQTLPLAGVIRWLSLGGKRPITASQVKIYLEDFPVEVCRAILLVLVKAGLASTEGNPDVTSDTSVNLMDEGIIQYILEIIHVLNEVRPELPLTVDQNIYWTPPSGLTDDGTFPRLDVFLEELVLGTQRRLIIVAPFFSPAGIERLGLSIVPLCKNKPEVTVTIVVDQLKWNNGMNRDALSLLKNKLADVGADNRFVLYSPPAGTSSWLSLHAKFLVCDRSTGFMGSANFTKGAMAEQLELGIRLTPGQSRKLADLVEHLINVKYLKRVSL